MSEQSGDFDPNHGDDGQGQQQQSQQQTSEGSALRTQLEAEKTKRRELEAENKNLKLEMGLDKAGLNELNDRQRKALLATHDGDEKPESLLATAVELGFAQAPPPPPEQQAAEGAQRISQAAQGGQSQESTVITAADVAGWDQPRQRRFLKQHPEEFDLLMRTPDAKVSGIAFN